MHSKTAPDGLPIENCRIVGHGNARGMDVTRQNRYASTSLPAGTRARAFPSVVSLAPVAQGIEYRPPKPRVTGSIPVGRANLHRTFPSPVPPQPCRPLGESRRLSTPVRATIWHPVDGPGDDPDRHDASTTTRSAPSAPDQCGAWIFVRTSRFSPRASYPHRPTAGSHNPLRPLPGPASQESPFASTGSHVAFVRPKPVPDVAPSRDRRHRPHGWNARTRRQIP